MTSITRQLSSMLILSLLVLSLLFCDTIDDRIDEGVDYATAVRNQMIEEIFEVLGDLGRFPDLDRVEEKFNRNQISVPDSIPVTKRIELRLYFRPDDLVRAARNGYTLTAGFLIATGFDPDFLDRDSFTPLLIGARNGHYEIVDLLIRNGADIEWPDEDGITPLRYAQLFQHHSVVELLLQHGAQVNRRDRYRWTPLLSAVANNDPDMVDLLLQHGANPELKTTRGDYPLIEAIYQRNERIVSLLLKGGADPDVRDVRYDLPAIFLVIEENNLRLVTELIEAGANLEIREPQFKETPLIRGVKLGFAEIVEILLREEAEVNAVDDNDWSPLFYALAAGSYHLTDKLLEHGCDPNLTDNNGRTALSLWNWRIDEDLRELVSTALESQR